MISPCSCFIRQIIALSNPTTAPTINRARETLDGIGRESKRFADITNGALSAVTDDFTDECGAMASVLGVDVLDDLLATLMLEIDVDIGWFTSLSTDEAFKEHLHAIWINCGDTERETHRAVCRCPATLTENPTRAREGDDVLHCQEVRRVGEVIDDGEFVFKLMRHFRRNTARIALACALPDEFAQVLHRRHALRDNFVGVLVAQLAERERGCSFKKTPRGFDGFWLIAVAPKDFRWAS